MEEGSIRGSNGQINMKKNYKITKLPKYLVFNLDRKIRQTGGGGGAVGGDQQQREMNPTIVSFPAKNLELRDYYFPVVGGGGGGNISSSSSTKYDLVANICYRHSDTSTDKVISIGTQSGPPGVSTSSNNSNRNNSNINNSSGGTYLVHIHNKATDQWYEIHDLVVSEILPHQIALSESHMLIYELRV